MKEMQSSNSLKMQQLKFDNKRSRVQVCPCGKSNKDGKFIPYIDHDNCGYCHSCGETFLPKLQSDNTEQWRQSEAFKTKYVPKKILYTSLSYEFFKQSIAEIHYAKNTFITFLYAFFSKKEVDEVLDYYHIGTYFEGKNECVFWYVNDKNICRAKAFVYDVATCKPPFLHTKGICKRQKDVPYSTFEITKRILKAMNQSDYQIPHCLFGSHLLTSGYLRDKPVGIVESEKTAIICSICNPDYIWLATGGMQRLDSELFKGLIGREIWLFPDLGLANPKTQLTPFQVWSNELAAIKLVCGEQVYISTLLENECSSEERTKGYDLADYYLAEYRNQFH